MKKYRKSVCFSAWQALTLLCLLIFACDEDRKAPLSPEHALGTFVLPDGFRIELVASEPLISDPVEIAFDADGFLYVAEMEDYPAQGAPGGRIMMLEDADGNGHYEKGNVFADSLPYVNGVMPWRRGVLVTSAPDIIYLEDTTGDRRADIRQVVVTGFAFTNPQLRMSSLRYGFDNWIYGAYSRAGGQRGYPEFTNHGSALTFPANPRRDSADIYPGTDFRFRPDVFAIQPAGGMSQFGMAFDARGNRFTIWNNIHARHVVLEGRYALTNPWFNVSNVMASISDHGNAATVYSRAENRLDLHESEIGHFTSACGISVYTGDLFPQPYAGALFVCEPVSNIVHADALTKNDATFSASRIQGGEEFLSSTDSWFRPVNTTVGPDGGLYVVDFYRKLVEHPAWIAHADDKGIYTHAGVLQEADFLEGNDRGRIYRIVPDDYQYSANDKPSLSKADGEQLVAKLDHPNLWWRINAQRLLVGRQDTSVTPGLKKLFQDNASSAEAKVHALRTLEGLHALDESLILAALRHRDTFVREQGLAMAEPHLSNPAIQQAVFALVEEGALQFQIARTLSLLPPDVSFPHLQRIAQQRIGDEWFHKALLLSARDNALDWYRSIGDLEAKDSLQEAGKSALLRELATITARRGRVAEISSLILEIAKEQRPSSQHAALGGLVEGLPQHATRLRISTHAQDALVAMITTEAGEVQSAAITLAEKIHFERWNQLAAVLGEDINRAFDASKPAQARAVAVRILGLDPAPVNIAVFRKLLGPEQPQQVRAAAAQALIRREEAPALHLLCERFNASTPEVRAIIESGFARSTNRVAMFVDAMESEAIDPALLSPAFRSRLVQHPEKSVGQRAQKLVANTLSRSRTEVVNAYYESTIIPGDAAKGKEVFRNRCSTCHEMDNVGRAFGPDLLSVSNQTRINLLTMIIDPNNNIAPGYDGYFIETKDGRTFTGILSNESSLSVSFRTADGKEETILRETIATMRPMTTSLMPEGLEAGMSKEDVAGLLKYLKFKI